MPTIDKRELGICAEQQGEEWEVLWVRFTQAALAHLVIYNPTVYLP